MPASEEIRTIDYEVVHQQVISDLTSRSDGTTADYVVRFSADLESYDTDDENDKEESVEKWRRKMRGF